MSIHDSRFTIHDCAAGIIRRVPDRLESWKEIAAYLNRSERTVRRWEAHEGLPVHRLQHDKRGSVYAYARELDAWRESRRQLVSTRPSDVTTPAPSARRRVWRWVAWLAFPVAGLLTGIVLLGRGAPSAPYSPSPEALRAFKQGAFSGNAGRIQVASGIRNFEEAIRLDAMFADAWSALAYAHIAQTFFDEAPTTETLVRARREAQRAGRLRPSALMPGPALAAISHYLDWDHAAAEQQFRKSIALSPDLAVAHSWFAEFLLDLRRFDEAAVSARQAQETSPRWLEPIVVSGNIHLFTGHVDLAIAEYERALATEPAFGLANHFLGRAFLAKGNHGRAIQQLRKSNELLGAVPFSIGDLGYALAASGRRAEAERMLADIMAKRRHQSYPALPIATIYMGLGQPDLALEWLERAAEERLVGYYMPSVDPIYDPVRSHPRFRALLSRMNLDR
jgi:tetratricopeptide (TPR) repeat protein